ncbi:MAG TPA: LCP family protein [Streptosporangiaceae bacterium]|nr:LCP family protein [Streptosporangiaceae bacterium]
MPHGPSGREPDYPETHRPRRDASSDYRWPAADTWPPADGGGRSRQGSGTPAGPSRHAGRRGRAAEARARWRRKRALAKAGYITATVVAVVAMVAGIGAYAEYRRLEGNITKVKVGGLSGRTVYGALNILVLGSQQRAGQKGHFGVAAGDSPETSNSDNLLLIHLDPTHTHATILSIPRDLFVYEPGCKARSRFIGIGIQGPYTYPPGNLIDGALNIGGPTCAVATVKDLTGISLDHFVEFDFNSFRTMVDALGGVEVCVPKGGYHDPKSHVNLSRGLHLLKYDRALAYVRTRDSLGGPDAGGDLPRIELQQAFISSIVQKVNKQGLLSNGLQLLSIANTATKALTVDQGLGSVSELVSLARSLVNLKSRDVSLITLPTTTDTFDYPTYAEHLMAVQPQDDVLYQMVRTGQVWHGHLPVQPYAKVSVRVLNGTGQRGLARRTAAKLRQLGFNVTGTGNAASTTTTTVDYAGLEQADGAYTLMTALKVSSSSKFPAGQNTLAEPASQIGKPGTVTLILGTDFTGVNPPGGHKTRAGKKSAGESGGGTTVQSRNAAANICSGLPTRK